MSNNYQLATTRSQKLPSGIGGQFPDQCLFFTDGVLIIGATTSVKFGNRKIEAKLEGRFQVFVKTPLPVGQVLTISLSGGFVAKDAHDSVVADFEFSESFQNADYLQHFYFDKLLENIDIQLSDIASIQFLEKKLHIP